MKGARWTIGRKRAVWDGPQQVEPAGPWFMVEVDMRLDACDYLILAPEEELREVEAERDEWRRIAEGD